MQLPPTSSLPSDTPGQGGNRRTMIMLIAGGVVALILIAVGGVVLAGQFFTSRPNSIPQLLAGDTQIYAAITPNLNDLPNINQLRKAFPEAADYQNDTTFNDGLKDEMGVTFNEDIASWIGTEAAVAISGLPFDDMFTPDFGSSDSSDIAAKVQAIFVLTSRDEAAAKAFLDKQRTHREGKGEQFVSSETEGVTIYAQQQVEAPTPIAAFALVRGNVVFATSPELIAAIVTRDPNGKETLAANGRFQQVLAAISPDRIGFVFVNGQPLAQAIQANGDAFVAELPEATANQVLDQLDSLQALQGIGASLSVLADGVAFDALTVFDPAGLSQASADQLKDAATPVSADRVANVSADALVALSFRLPASYGEQIRESIAGTPELAEQVALFEQQFSLDLERDLLSWLQGEGTIVLLPGEDIMGSPSPVTGYLALKPNDRGAAEDGMGRIIAALDTASGGQLGLAEQEIGGVTWQAFSPSGQALGGYGFVGDDLVIAFGMTALEAAAGPPAALSANPAYQTGIKALPSPNGGLVFINLPSVLALANEFGAINDPEQVDRMAPFKAITAGGIPGMSDKGVTYGRLFLVIAAE